MNEEELMNPTIRNCKFAYKCDKDWDELVENVKLDHCVAFLNDQGFLLMGDINRSN